jgi:hypothetical protein
LINNRQNGRRRGRGGQRSPGGNPGRSSDNGNRIDNRARGNAAQLLEKYKTLARDAQMQGDRVNTEYYLQFADHYFRVLAETRSRFEDNNQPRRQQFDGDDGDDFDGNDMGDGSSAEAAEFQANGNRRDRDERPRDDRPREDRPRAEDRPRDDRPRDDRPRNDRGRDRPQVRDRAPVEAEGNRGNDVAVAGGAADNAPDAAENRPRRGRPRRAVPVEDQAGSSETIAIEADRLPPAIGLTEDAASSDDEAPKPRRRRRTAADAATAVE